MSDSVKWKDPPPHPLYVWHDTLEPLMERPGQWAHVRTMKRESARATVHKLRNRGEIAVPDGEWEFDHRPVEGVDAAEIYAKYLGPTDE